VIKMTNGIKSETRTWFILQFYYSFYYSLIM
jgi:hypothetical protein